MGASYVRVQEEVVSEYRFALHEKTVDEWLEWQPNLSLHSRMLETNTPAPNLAFGVWRRHRFGVTRFGRKSAWVLPLDDGRILGSTEILTPHEKGKQMQYLLGYQEFKTSSSLMIFVPRVTENI